MKEILERYAYHMALYYGKPELEKEYNKMLNILTRDLINLKNTLPVVEDEYTEDIVIEANSISVEYAGCGSHKLLVKLNINKELKTDS